MTNSSTPTFRNVGDYSPNPLRIDAPGKEGWEKEGRGEEERDGQATKRG